MFKKIPFTLVIEDTTNWELKEDAEQYFESVKATYTEDGRVVTQSTGYLTLPEIEQIVQEMIKEAKRVKHG